MSAQTIIDYYANLLILQYIGKPKAYAMIQTLVTPVVMPVSGIDGGTAFTLVYDDNIDGGSAFTVVFDDTISGGNAEASVGDTLPLTVQDGFNILGTTDLAQGVQLDVIGKYAGVTRTAQGFTTQITLDDADFVSLIRMAISKNSAGSSLADIQKLLYQFFTPAQILVFDYRDMQMSFLISESVGSQDLIQLYITEGLLPVPMAVGYSVIYAPVINAFFSFRTYDMPAPATTRPFNSYTSYQTTWPWLSYANAVIF